MIGKLNISKNGKPQVITEKGVYNLLCCDLTKHTDGSYNFNMSLDSKYRAYKKGDVVYGIEVENNNFIAWSLVK